MPDKFKGMNRKEIAEYVWDYYKLHIISAVIVIILAGSLINTIFINPAPKQYVGVAVYGVPMDYSSIDALQQLLDDMVVPDTHKPGYAAMADNFYMDEDSNPQVSMALSQKFAALMMMGELDIIIADIDEFETLVDGGNFNALTEVLAEPQLELLADRLVCMDDTSQFYGVDITGSRALEACGIELEHPTAGFVITSNNQDAALRAFEVLFTQK